MNLAFREHMTQVMFETFNVPAMYVEVHLCMPRDTQAEYVAPAVIYATYSCGLVRNSVVTQPVTTCPTPFSKLLPTTNGALPTCGAAPLS